MAHAMIRVISLRRAAERRREMARQLDSLPYDWDFFDAHETPAADLVLHTNTWRRINGRMLHPREVACYSSHFAVLQEHAERAPDDILIVLEDDALLDPEFMSQPEMLTAATREFGYLRLNAQHYAPAVIVKDMDRRRIVRFKRIVLGALAYAVTARCAHHLVPYLKDLYRPFDIEIDRFWAHGVPNHCFYQFVALERSQESQIGNHSFEQLAFDDLIVWKTRNQIEKLRRFLYNVEYRLGLICNPVSAPQPAGASSETA